MPKRYKDHQSRSSTKVLITADSGAGKSGLLASLANAGQRLFIYDFDNGADIIQTYLKDDAARDRIFIETLKDTPENIHAFDTYKSLMWKGWTVDGEKLGSAKDWGSDTTIVIDSATFMSNAVKYWLFNNTKPKARPMSDQLTQPDWGDLVRELEWQIAQLTSDAIKANVVITAINTGIMDSNGIEKYYPDIGTRNFAKEVGGYFNNVVSIRRKKDETRVIRTSSDSRQDLKTSLGKKIPDELEFDLSVLFNLLQKGHA